MTLNVTSKFVLKAFYRTAFEGCKPKDFVFARKTSYAVLANKVIKTFLFFVDCQSSKTVAKATLIKKQRIGRKIVLARIQKEMKT